MPIKIKNRDARWLWLTQQGLAKPPTGNPDILGLIKSLGLVQLDTIQAVSRAHHHIIWSRNQHYREPMLDKLMSEKRGVFEHFTHDASVLPMEFFPMWQRQFKRIKNRIDRSNYYKPLPDRRTLEIIKERIAREGPLSTHAFDSEKKDRSKMWSRPPHKIALDYMWYAGDLATSHRENFTKYYDLAERVIPEDLRNQNIPDVAQIDWLCSAALERLGFGTLGQIRKFWEATEVSEVKDWAEQSKKRLVPVDIQAAAGSWSQALAFNDIETQIASLDAPTSRLRILNPFDPVVRDRQRLKQLFGFDYKIEIFVPAAKRQWGYYVFPLLEGDRFVGRLEAKADRAKGKLDISNVWAEPGVMWTRQRARKLDSELARLARLASVENVNWLCRGPKD